MKHIAALLLGLALIFLLFGCTSQMAPSTTDNTTPLPGTGTTSGEVTSSHTIVMQNSNFTPSSVTIKAGDKVIWTNFDGMQHTVVSDSGLFDSGLLAKGITFEYTFNGIGTFNYHCSVHPTMKGTIIVQ